METKTIPTVTAETGVLFPRVRGITPLHRADRPKPYGVRWFVEGKPKTKFFDDPERRDLFAAKVANDKAKSKDTLTTAEIREYRTIKAAIGDAPWVDVVAGWREHLRNTKRTECAKAVAPAVAEYLTSVKDKIAEDHYRHKKTQLERFAVAFPGRLLHQITSEEIEAWLPRSSPFTFNTYRKTVNALYSHWKVPVPEVAPLPAHIDEVGILTPEQTAALFAKAPRSIYARLACEAFAGLRFSSACRLAASDLLPGTGINLPAAKLKTKRRHFIDELPANLWGWVGLDDGIGWGMSPAAYMHAKTVAFLRANIPHPKNALRHSFATYHLAAYKNPGRTAALLCHRNQDMLWRHYNGRATKEQGEAYFSVRPE